MWARLPDDTSRVNVEYICFRIHNRPVVITTCAIDQLALALHFCLRSFFVYVFITHHCHADRFCLVTDTFLDGNFNRQMDLVTLATKAVELGSSLQATCFMTARFNTLSAIIHRQTVQKPLAKWIELRQPIH